jgi:predicted 2-oxoglutarate/Fe(II)-dependent dioxygenase YbiX
MFLELDDVLSPDELAQLRGIAAARFVDGRVSNPHSEVKKNLQIDPGEARVEEAAKLMAGALLARPVRQWLSAQHPARGQAGDRRRARSRRWKASL